MNKIEKAELKAAAEEKRYGSAIRKVVRAYKLSVRPHCKLPNAVNSYMIASGIGDFTAFIVGGAQCHMLASEMNDLCYPSVFKSAKSAERALAVNFNAHHRVELITDQLADQIKKPTK